MWKIRDTKAGDLSPAKRSRRVKIFWPAVLNRYRYSLFIDSTVELLVDPLRLIGYLEEGSDVCVFPHPDRNCLYEEGRAVVRLRKAWPAAVVGLRDVIAASYGNDVDVL